MNFKTSHILSFNRNPLTLIHSLKSHFFKNRILAQSENSLGEKRLFFSDSP
jgi:hypothetical protein